MSTPTRVRGRRNRIRAVPWLTRGAPWWVLVLLGVGLAVAGAFLLARPLSALGVLGLYVGASCLVSGIADLLAPADPTAGAAPVPTRPTWIDRVAPWWWIAVGIAVLVWLGRDITLLGPAVALLLIGSGLLALARLVTVRTLDQLIRALVGVAEIVFGLLALLWPDATLIVVAVLFGGRTLVFGVVLIWRGVAERLGRPSDSAAEAGGRRRWRTGLRLVAAVTVLALALVTGWVSHALRTGAPVVGAFYDTPAELPGRPGVLIRSEPYDGNLPDAAWSATGSTTRRRTRAAPSCRAAACSPYRPTTPRPHR